MLGKKGKVAGIHLKSGRHIKCQVLAVATGVRPNLALLRGLPIHTNKGILVNEYMRSNSPTLFAAGDVAQVQDRWTGQHHLDILWPSAINEGRAAGYNIVDVARGGSPSFTYQKSSPFNSALLFGLHLTVIGRVGCRDDDRLEELSHLSRGSSHVWTTPFTSDYRSAWDASGPNSLRIVMNDGRIVGAILLGNQELADPLRRLIENEADLSHIQSILLDDKVDLPQALQKTWPDRHENW